MKYLKLLLVCLLIFAKPGYCQKKFIAHAMGIYKTPRWETVQQIKSLAKKDSAAYDAFYFIKSYQDFQYFNKNHLLSFPGVYIFNKDLQPVKALDATDCGWQAQQFISTLTDTTATLPDSGIKFTLQDFMAHSAFVAGDSNIIAKGDFDYLYIYTWVSYLPKFMKAQFEYSRKIKNNKNISIKVISLNADFMAQWNENPEKLAGKKVKKLPAQ